MEGIKTRRLIEHIGVQLGVDLFTLLSVTGVLPVMHDYVRWTFFFFDLPTTARFMSIGHIGTKLEVDIHIYSLCLSKFPEATLWECLSLFLSNA